MKRDVLALAAFAEIATGAALLVAPSTAGRLLLGAPLDGVAVPVARVTGLALIALGVSCWPGPPLVGMVTYGATVALYLAYLGAVGGFTGFLLWPAVVLHLVVTTRLVQTHLDRRQRRET